MDIYNAINNMACVEGYFYSYDPDFKVPEHRIKPPKPDSPYFDMDDWRRQMNY